MFDMKTLQINYCETVENQIQKTHPVCDISSALARALTSSPTASSALKKYKIISIESQDIYLGDLKKKCVIR